MNPNEMLLVIPHSLLASETIGGDIHGVSLKKNGKMVLQNTLRPYFYTLQNNGEHNYLLCFATMIFNYFW